MVDNERQYEQEEKEIKWKVTLAEKYRMEVNFAIHASLKL